MFLSLSLSQSNVERYVAAHSFCIAKAETMCLPEIAAFWQAIANQYKFLYQWEIRLLEERERPFSSHPLPSRGTVIDLATRVARVHLHA
jgi:hypothetical protein